MRALAPAACLAVAAAIGLAALAFELNLSADQDDLGSLFDDANRADTFASILALLGLALAAAAHGVVLGARRVRVALASAAGALGAACLGFCIVGVVEVYRESGFDLFHAYAWLSFARTAGFAALALAVLSPPLARRWANAAVAGLGLTAVGSAAYAITLSYGSRFFAWTSLALTAAILAAAAAFAGRRLPVVGEVVGPR